MLKVTNYDEDDPLRMYPILGRQVVHTQKETGVRVSAINVTTGFKFDNQLSKLFVANFDVVRGGTCTLTTEMVDLDGFDGISIVNNKVVNREYHYDKVVTFDDVPATDIKIDSSDPSFTLFKGNSKKLTFIATPYYTTDDIIWESSDTSVATVEDGLVVAKHGGTAIIKVKSESGMYDTREIIVNDIRDATVTLNDHDFIYDGKEKKATVASINYGKRTLVENTDYKILKYENNINAGTAYIYICDPDDSSIYIKKEYTIAPKDIDKLTYIFDKAVIYTGQITDCHLVVKDGNKELVYGVDYQKNPQSCIDIGTASLIVEGLGNYTSSHEVNYAITPIPIENANVQIGEVTYTGQELIPTVEVRVDGRLLYEGIDYKASYRNNVNVGTGYVDIEGIGNYLGNIKDNTFKINPKPIDAAKIMVNKCTYTGNEIEPDMLVTLDGTLLIKDSDYKVEYYNNINVGSAMIFCYGIGNYTSTAISDFEIVKSTASLSLVLDPIKITQGDTLSISIVLKIKNTNQPIKGKTVTLYLGDLQYKYTTDNDGQIEDKKTIDLDEGKYSIYANFTGNNNLYSASSNKQTLIVSKPIEPTTESTEIPTETQPVTETTKPTETEPVTIPTKPTETQIVTVPTETTIPKYILGDADMNGKVDVVDATCVQKYVAKALDIKYIEIVAADVDKSGKVDIVDATMIQKYVAKLIDHF